MCLPVLFMASALQSYKTIVALRFLMTSLLFNVLVSSAVDSVVPDVVDPLVTAAMKQEAL